ncbi:MAG: flavin reductase-like, FMN-binding [Caulobacteraceae bacterium]|nr:flavin reductase-like, FMN-binding [Caulobacteraceae bacterium]
METAAMDTLTETKFRTAMRRLTSTIAIVSARGEEDTGVLMTSATSLCMDPPSVLVAVNQKVSAHAAIKASGLFRVNLLHADHIALLEPFSGKMKGAERFQIGSWSFEADGARLTDAVASIGCVADGSLDYGSHTIFVGRVTDVVLGDLEHTLLWREGQSARTDA